MILQTSTLRPGFLVSLKTSVKGNANYSRHNLEHDHVTEDGSKKARWETERTITDPIEYEAAQKARSLAGATVRRVCANTAFGLLCPEDDGSKLDEAIKEARKIAEEFNNTATLTNVSVYVIVGRVAQDDVEAVRAINSEVRDLLSDMERGLSNLDVRTVRDAASRARSIGTMLSPAAAERVQIAIDTARSTARKIVAAGEQAAQEVDRAAIAKIAESRTSFLDLDDAKEIAKPIEQARVIDLLPAEQ